MAENLTDASRDLIQVTKEKEGPKISFDAQQVFMTLQNLQTKAKAKTGSNENFVATFTSAVEQIQRDIDDPNQRTNALIKIRELNNAKGLKNDAQLEAMLRGLNSPTLDTLMKARLSGSVQAELIATKGVSGSEKIPLKTAGIVDSTPKVDLSAAGAYNTVATRGRKLDQAIDAAGK